MLREDAAALYLHVGKRSNLGFRLCDLDPGSAFLAGLSIRVECVTRAEHRYPKRWNNARRFSRNRVGIIEHSQNCGCYGEQIEYTHTSHLPYFRAFSRGVWKDTSRHSVDGFSIGIGDPNLMLPDPNDCAKASVPSTPKTCACITSR